ncbi:MAG: precorrin-4 C(11)-methyltransferase [Dehalococcoidia bacterium]
MSDSGRGGTVSFVGAGPGAPDLLTIRGRERIAQADLLIYADSLVHPGVAACAADGAEVIGSASLTLEETTARMLSAVRNGKYVVRVQSGDPSVYGAMHEQLTILEQEGVPYEIVPGVSSAFAAAAALHTELTVPDISQTVILTRMAGRTTLPPGESMRDLARHGASLVIFLSIPMIERVVEELREGGYPAGTPAAVVYRVTWEEELILRGTLDDIAAKAKAAKVQLQALILVGPVLDESLRQREAHHRSNLYNPSFTQRHRHATAGASEPAAGGTAADGS